MNVPQYCSLLTRCSNQLDIYRITIESVSIIYWAREDCTEEVEFQIPSWPKKKHG